MKCKYNYRLSTVFLTPLMFSGKPDYTRNATQEDMTERINNAMNEFIDKFEKEKVGENEEFEINSHNICFIDDVVVLSILFQKKSV